MENCRVVAVVRKVQVRREGGERRPGARLTFLHLAGAELAPRDECRRLVSPASRVPTVLVVRRCGREAFRSFHLRRALNRAAQCQRAFHVDRRLHVSLHRRAVPSLQLHPRRLVVIRVAIVLSLLIAVRSTARNNCHRICTTVRSLLRPKREARRGANERDVRVDA